MKTKKVTKIMSFLLVSVLTVVLGFSSLGLGWNVQATEDDTTATDPTGTITIVNNPDESHISIVGTDSNNTFTAYKIFTLKQEQGEGSDKTAYDYEVNSKLTGFFTDKEYTDSKGTKQTVDANSNDSIRTYIEATLYGYDASGNVNTTASATKVEEFANAMKSYINDNEDSLSLTVNSDYFTVAATTDDVSFDNKTYSESVKFESLPLGYYLIVGGGKSNDTNKSSVVTSCILDTTTYDKDNSTYSVTLKLKAGIPTSTKYIWQAPADGTTFSPTNGKNAEESSASIGDVVTFKVYSCLPNLTGYTSYTYKMTDTFSDGLDLGYYDSDNAWQQITVTDENTTAEASSAVKVYVEETDKNDSTKKTWVDITTANDSCNWESTFTPRSTGDTTTSAKLEITPKASSTEGDNGFEYLKSLVAAYGAGARLMFVYQAKLNSNAVIASTGNENSAKVTYTNGPDSKGTNDTPESIVKVYTYDLAVYKYTESDSSKTALSGAQFLVYPASQVDTTSSALKSNATPITIEKHTNGTALSSNTPYSAQETSYVKDSTTYTAVTSDDEGNIKISGLGEGTYYLKEVVAPEGYNLKEDLIKVTIDGTVDVSTSKVNGMTIATGETDYVTQYPDATGTTSTDVTGVKVSVLNNTGTELPSTGAMGTTMIYIVGGILIAGSVIFITVRKLAKQG